MKHIFSVALLALLSLSNAAAQQAGYAQLKAEAERLYAAGSYARANELYSKADRAALPPAEARWLEFRLADTSWRAQAATETSDQTKPEQAHFIMQRKMSLEIKRLSEANALAASDE
jgi:hypothetical protein